MRLLSRVRVPGAALAAALVVVSIGAAQPAGASSAVGVARSAGASPAAGVARSALAAASVRTLKVGMSGPDVTALQQRLADLRYFPGPIDGQFGQYTLEAVWAFQEVQGMHVTGEVGPPTRTALANPRQPHVLAPRGGKLRVEINLRARVLVLYRSAKVALISHVSTGGGYYYCSPGGGCGYAITPTGNFKTTVFMPGWVTVPLGQMYSPVFFIRTSYAIHGSESVPLQPASHGCVRIPMDIAKFFHNLVPTSGSPVYIRHHG